MTTPDEYTYWRARLAGQDVPLPDEPAPGRYRIPARRTDGVGYRPAKSTPVAVWRIVGVLMVMIGEKRISSSSGEDWHSFVSETWPRCMAVTANQYNAAINGGSWPDESDAVTRSNQAPPDDTLEAITERIADLAREAQRLIDKGAAQTKDEADQASDLANLLGKLEKRADELRVKEKEPHLIASRDVDDKWRAPIADARAAKETLKDVVAKPFLVALKKEQDEAEFQRLLSGDTKEFHPAEKPKATAGSRGRPVSLRTQKRAVIEDQDALYQACREHPKVKSALQEIADAAAKSGTALPGTNIVTEDKAI